MVMGDLKFAGLIAKTEQLTRSITLSAVFPISKPDRPDLPIVPMTISEIITILSNFFNILKPSLVV